MYLTGKESRIRQKEAQNARDNRAEIVRALSQGRITRRDLVKWGIFTIGGLLVGRNGLSPFAPSAFADGVPTGTPRSPLFGTQKFTQHMPRLDLETPVSLTRNGFAEAVFPANFSEPNAKRLSYHTDFSQSGDTLLEPGYRQRAGGGPPARGVLCASEVGGVLPQGRLCHVAGAGRVQQQIPP